MFQEVNAEYTKILKRTPGIFDSAEYAKTLKRTLGTFGEVSVEYPKTLYF